MSWKNFSWWGWQQGEKNYQKTNVGRHYLKTGNAVWKVFLLFQVYLGLWEMAEIVSMCCTLTENKHCGYGHQDVWLRIELLFLPRRQDPSLMDHLVNCPHGQFFLQEQLEGDSKTTPLHNSSWHLILSS